MTMGEVCHERGPSKRTTVVVVRLVQGSYDRSVRHQNDKTYVELRGAGAALQYGISFLIREMREIRTSQQTSGLRLGRQEARGGPR